MIQVGRIMNQMQKSVARVYLVNLPHEQGNRNSNKAREFPCTRKHHFCWRARISDEVASMWIEVCNVGMSLALPTSLADMWLFQALPDVVCVLFAELLSVCVSSPIVLRRGW